MAFFYAVPFGRLPSSTAPVVNCRQDVTVKSCRQELPHCFGNNVCKSWNLMSVAARKATPDVSGNREPCMVTCRQRWTKLL
jgi:hypothetical protein